MSPEVFISYARGDASTAEEICAGVESHGVRCWYAPRNIDPAQDWASAITAAIDAAQAMVVVLSKNANESHHVEREIGRAGDRNKTILPFRIEDVEPSGPQGSLGYYLRKPQWLDAFSGPRREHIDKLAKTLVATLGRADSEGCLDCHLRLSGEGNTELTVQGRSYVGRVRLGELRRLAPSVAGGEREYAETLPLKRSRYGAILFDALMPRDEDVHRGFREALCRARQHNNRLRFRFEIERTADLAFLQELRWELLYEPRYRLSFARSREVLFSRYVRHESQPPPPAEQPRMLVVASCPSDAAEHGLSVLDKGSARRLLEGALSALHGKMEYVFLDGPATAKRIDDELEGGGFNALHLMAPGRVEAGRDGDQCGTWLALEKEDGTADLLDEKTLSETVQDLKELRLVVVAAPCSRAVLGSGLFSRLGYELARHRGVPAVVTMGQEVSVEAVEEFTRDFYKALADWGSIDRAVNEARHDMRLARSPEWGAPVYYSRLVDDRLRPSPAVASSGSEVGAEARIGWGALIESIAADKCVPILGPGLCHGLLPSADEIARRWARQCENYPLREDMPTVAQFLEITEGQGYPHDLLPKELVRDLLEREGIQEQQRFRDRPLREVIDRLKERYFDNDPDEPHRILADLNLSLYLATNFDSFMSAALSWQGREPVRRRCLWQADLADLDDVNEYQLLEGTRDEPLVFHLFGNDEHSESQVLTENDHLDFLRSIAAEPERIPRRVRSRLTESVLLLLGYDLRDLGCRAMLRGLIAQLRKFRHRVAVLQLQPDEMGSGSEEAIRYFFKEGNCKELQIKVYWGSVRQFLKETRQRLNERATV